MPRKYFSFLSLLALCALRRNGFGAQLRIKPKTSAWLKTACW